MSTALHLLPDFILVITTDPTVDTWPPEYPALLFNEYDSLSYKINYKRKAE
jgi:hypothetical protein